MPFNFTCLPGELQNHIWELTIQQRVIPLTLKRIQGRCISHPKTRCSICAWPWYVKSTARPPPALHVCRASRSWIQWRFPNYTESFLLDLDGHRGHWVSFDRTRPAAIVIDPDLDVLRIGCEDLRTLIPRLRRRYRHSIPLIRTMEINMPIVPRLPGQYLQAVYNGLPALERLTIVVRKLGQNNLSMHRRSCGENHVGLDCDEYCNEHDIEALLSPELRDSIVEFINGQWNRGGRAARVEVRVIEDGGRELLRIAEGG